MVGKHLIMLSPNQKKEKKYDCCSNFTLRSWFLRPLKYTPGAGIGGLAAMVKFVLEERRRAKQYLVKRHLQRPVIAWNTVHAMWAETHSKSQ